MQHDPPRPHLVVEAQRRTLIVRPLTGEPEHVIERIRNAVVAELIDGGAHAVLVALAVHVGERVRVHRLHADPHHGAARVGERARHVLGHRVGVGVALERQADLAAIRGRELAHPVDVEREDRVPEEDLPGPTARLPVAQLGNEMLDRPAPHRLLARVLLREDAVLAEAATKRAAAARDHVELALERRHVVVEDSLVGPGQGVEIGDERAHRILDQGAVAFEPRVRHVRATEAILLRARQQIEQGPFALALDHRVDGRLTDAVGRRAADVRAAEDDRRRCEALARPRHLDRPAMRDGVGAEGDDVGPGCDDPVRGVLGRRLEHAREQRVVRTAVGRERLRLVDQLTLVAVRLDVGGQGRDAEVLESTRDERDAHPGPTRQCGAWSVASSALKITRTSKSRMWFISYVGTHEHPGPTGGARSLNAVT